MAEQERRSVMEHSIGLSPQISKALGKDASDVAALEALGYESKFKRELSLWSSFSVSFALLGLLPSVATTMVYGIGYIGPAISWSWLIASIGIQAVALSMAELASCYPSAGGLYYAAAVLAPQGWGPIASWATGWSNYIIQIMGPLSIDYGAATMVLSLKNVAQDTSDWTPERYQIFLVAIGFLIAQSAIASMPTKFIARFNSFGTILNGIAIFVTIIILLAANKNSDPKFNDSKFVWRHIENQTEWPDGVAILMSFVAIIWTMSGYDAGFHLSEETHNAPVNAPRVIVMTAAIGGLLGWALLLTISYTVVDIPAVMNAANGQPFIAYLQQVLSKKLVFFVSAVTIVAAFFMGSASATSASRVTFAYARDRVLPFSEVLSQVNSRTQTPVNAAWLNCLLGCSILLLVFAGDIAIEAVFSVGAIAAYVAFTLPVAIKVLFTGNNFRPGPWHLGKWSRPIGALSVSYVLLIIPILCLPTTKGKDLNLQNMNWTCLVYFGPMSLAMLWYALYARKFFKGPKVSFEHLIHDNDPDNVVLEGVDATPVDNHPVVDK